MQPFLTPICLQIDGKGRLPPLGPTALCAPSLPFPPRSETQLLCFEVFFKSWKDLRDYLVQFPCLCCPKAQRGEDSWPELMSGQV